MSPSFSVRVADATAVLATFCLDASETIRVVQRVPLDAVFFGSPDGGILHFSWADGPSSRSLTIVAA